MDNELEIQDTLEPESVQDTTPEIDISEKLGKYKEVANNQKIRAEKAEAELKKLKAQQPQEESNKPQSNEPDYAKLAFLEGKGIKHPDDQKIVQDEAKLLNLPLTDILGMEHIKSKLKTISEQREAENGMPDSSGKPSGGNKSDANYWVNKTDPATGEYLSPPGDDLELNNKVIEARMQQHTAKSKFSDTMY